MKKLQLQQIIKEEISKVLKESVNEGLSNYSLLDFFKEMQSFPAAGVDAKDIKGASQPHNKKKTVKNTPELKRLLDDWQSGRYDEDPGTLVGELRHLLTTNSKDVRTGFSASDIKSLDVVADDISDAFSKYGTLKLHLPYNKWVKMDDDEKAWNVEQALYKLTKSSTVKKLLSKKEDDVIAYVVKVLSESVNEKTNFILGPTPGGDPHKEYGKPFFIEVDSKNKRSVDKKIKSISLGKGAGPTNKNLRVYWTKGKFGDVARIEASTPGALQDLLDVLDTKKDGIQSMGWVDLEESVKEGWFDIFKKNRGPSLDEEAWFDKIAKDALKQLQRHHKWKDMELAAMGPGNKKNYMDMAITSSKKRGPEYEFKVSFDPKTDKVKKIEELPSPWGESVKKANKKENMKKSTKLFNEAAIDGDMPINKWERTAVAFEEGPMIVGSHKGKYYIATGITEPGSMDKIIDVIDVEPVSKSDYDFIQKKQM